MTPESKNTEIALLCGWVKGSGNQGFIYEPSGCYAWDGIPNYVDDLNAMHEAESTITFAQRSEMNNLLGFSTGVGKGINEFRFVWQATAAERAEAFLRVKGKWKS